MNDKEKAFWVRPSEEGKTMTVKETIAELLRDVEAKGFWGYGTDCHTGKVGGHEMTVDDIADYLVENGVTFATDNNVGNKWIPVTEKLPDEDGTYLVITNYGTVTTAKYYTSKTFPATQIMPQYTSVAKWQSNRNPTHWMPLPPPPKEE